MNKQFILSIAGINRALKNKFVLSNEKFNIFLIFLLHVLWKKRFIVGYKLLNKNVEIFYKYTNSGENILKYLNLKSKPSNFFFKKKTISWKFSILTNSKLGYFLAYRAFCAGILLLEILI